MINLDPYLAVYFITFVALILLRVPIAYAMMASAFEYVVFNHQSFVMFAQKTANSLADFNMLALPAFLFVGCFMNEVGLTDRLFGMFEKWIGTCPAAWPTRTFCPPWCSPACPAPLWQTPAAWVPSKCPP